MPYLMSEEERLAGIELAMRQNPKATVVYSTGLMYTVEELAESFGFDPKTGHPKRSVKRAKPPKDVIKVNPPTARPIITNQVVHQQRQSASQRRRAEKRAHLQRK